MKMKFHFYLLLATLFAGLAFASCDTKDPEVPTPEPETVIPADPFTLAVSGSTIEDLKVDVTINKDVEISNFVVGLTPAGEQSDSLSIANLIINELKNKEVDFAAADDTYIFNSAAEVNLAEAWELEYSTEYIIAAFAIDENGEVASGVNHTSVTTDAEVVVEPEIEILKGAFVIDVTDISGNAATIAITPIEEVVNYYAVCKKTSEVGDDADLYFNNTIAGLIEAGDYNFANPDNTNLFTGRNSIGAATIYGAELEGSTNYTIAVAAINEEGILLSEVAHTAFDTEQVLLENAFTFSTIATATDNITIDLQVNEAVEYYYISALPTKAFATGYGNSADYYMETIIAAAGATSKDLEEQVAAGLAHKGSALYQASSLVSLGVTAGTEYIFIAVGVMSDGSYSTKTSTFKATTKDPLPADMFELESHDITTTTAMVNVYPKANAGNYYVICQPYSLLEQTTAGDCEKLMAMMLENDKATNATDFTQVNNRNLFNGDADVDPSKCYGFNFAPSTTYTMIVAGVDATGALTTACSSINFTTETEGVDEDVDPFTLSIANITSSDVEVAVSPAANVPYYYASVAPKMVIDGHYNGDPNAYITDNFKYDWTNAPAMLASGKLHEGEQTLSASTLAGMPLNLGTEYYFIVLGVNEAGETLGSMSKVVVPSEPKVEMFTLTASEITSSDITITVSPNADVEYYYLNTTSTSNLENVFKQDIESFAKGEVEMYLSMSQDMEILLGAKILFKGENEFSIAKYCGTLSPNTEYQVAALAISADGKIVGSSSIAVSSAE